MSNVVSLLESRFDLITQELKLMVSDGKMPACSGIGDGNFDHKLIFARLCGKDIDFYLSAFCLDNNAAYAYAHNNDRNGDSDFGSVAVTSNIIAHYWNYGLDIRDLHLDMTWTDGIALNEALRHERKTK